MSDEVRIIQCVKLTVLCDNDDDALGQNNADYNNNVRQEAEQQLAQAFADGFALESVVTGGNAQTLLTTWTMRKHVDGEESVSVDTVAELSSMFGVIDGTSIPTPTNLNVIPSNRELVKAVHFQWNDPVHQARLDRADLDMRTLQ